jgi:hypothetical protein
MIGGCIRPGKDWPLNIPLHLDSNLYPPRGTLIKTGEVMLDHNTNIIDEEDPNPIVVRQCFYETPGYLSQPFMMMYHAGRNVMKKQTTTLSDN